MPSSSSSSGGSFGVVILINHNANMTGIAVMPSIISTSKLCGAIRPSVAEMTNSQVKHRRFLDTSSACRLRWLYCLRRSNRLYRRKAGVSSVILARIRSSSISCWVGMVGNTRAPTLLVCRQSVVSIGLAHAVVITHVHTHTHTRVHCCCCCGRSTRFVLDPREHRRRPVT